MTLPTYEFLESEAAVWGYDMKTKPVRKRAVACLVITIVAAGFMPAPSHAAPVVTGSVLVGDMVFGADCFLNAMCLVWSRTPYADVPVPGCQEGEPTAQKDNAIYASIAKLPSGVAGTQRTINFGLKQDGTGFISGSGPAGAGVDFFNSSCGLVRTNPALPRPLKPGGPGIRFTVPASAKFIVVTGHQVTGLTWSLT